MRTPERTDATRALTTAAHAPSPGGSEMAARCGAFGWAATPLGLAASWPAALRAAVRLMLATPVATSLWCGPSYTLVYNDAYRRILGVKHPAALGRSGAAVWDELWSALEPQFAQVRAGGAPIYEDESLLRVERLEGGRAEDAWFTYALSALTDDDGTSLAVYNVAVETTARVHADRAIGVERERLRTLVLQMPVPVALHEGPEHRFMLVNAAFRRVCGGHDVTGLTIREAFPEMAGQGIWELFDRVYTTGEPWLGPETRVHYDRLGTGTAEDAWFDLRYEPVRDADGRITGILNVSFDVTDQVRARQQVERLLGESERARAEAETANRAKGEFLAVMSHELRTPLNAIGGYAELLELGIRGPVTPEQRTDVAKIQRSQRHLLGLINGVLNYARVEAGAVHYAITDVLLDPVLATCEALIAPQVRAKGLRLACDAADRTLRVRADGEKLQQVVLNLLSNAVKFTEPGGRVALRCTAAGAAGGDAVRVQVTDTGIGIPADRLAHAFEPFVQLDARLTRTQEGTGLGLAISRDLARGMGGDLTAESTPGVGSTFTLTLPMSAAD